jgi:aquaporin Z
MTRTTIAADAAGTALPVLLGAAALQGAAGDPAAVLLAGSFAVAVLAAVLGPARLGGAHLTPVLSLGLWLTGRVNGREFATHTAAQAGGLALAAMAVGAI